MGALPTDIPAVPRNTYAKSGWSGLGDWLGTGIISNRLRQFRSFEDARIFVRGLDLKSQNEWSLFCKGKLPQKGILPRDIPSTPSRTYADSGWAGMGDWLGTQTVASSLRQFRPFGDARSFARRLGLKSITEWREFCKGNLLEKGARPSDIPTNPDKYYANVGWLGWSHWLATETIATRLRTYRPFEEARHFARGLGLKGLVEWKEFCKGSLPADIPASPNNVYAESGWAGLHDWLGTENVAKQLRAYQSFEAARTFACSLGLKNQGEWQDFCKGKRPEKGKLPQNISASPHKTYAKAGWAGWGDWLGTGNVAPWLRQYRQFEDARAFARSLGLKSYSEWRDFCKGNLPAKGTLPSDIPAVPRNTYADSGWAGNGDWLGTGNVAPRLRRFRPFKNARIFVRSLELEGQSEWFAFCKGKLPEKGTLPSDIPSYPYKTYADEGWAGMPDWLGTARTRVSKAPKRKT
jgi:hypothetical protein